MVEIGFPKSTETKDSQAVTDREGRINGHGKCFCSCEFNKLDYLIQSKLMESTQVQWFTNVWKPDLKTFS